MSLLWNNCKCKHEKFVFIDLGAKNGDTVDWFLNTYPERLRNCVIYAFEANPQNKHDMMRYKSMHPELDLRLINKAAWIDDNGVDFTLDKDLSNKQGGSMFHYNQPHLRDMPTIPIESMDFPLWILENVSSNDVVLLKMDIEGSEYKIIEKMFENGGIELVDTLVVEFHDRFMKYNSGYYIEKIKKYDIELILWQ